MKEDIEKACSELAIRIELAVFMSHARRNLSEGESSLAFLPALPQGMDADDP